jgi:hypothetical protein
MLLSVDGVAPADALPVVSGYYSTPVVSLMDVICFVLAGIGLVGKHPENHAENGADKRHRSSTLREWQHSATA